jgi:hypothetical protein
MAAGGRISRRFMGDEGAWLILNGRTGVVAIATRVSACSPATDDVNNLSRLADTFEGSRF